VRRDNRSSDEAVAVNEDERDLVGYVANRVLVSVVVLNDLSSVVLIRV
jgi:hypothetical protein